MATTPTYTAAQILALSKAIASGATSVAYGDKRVDYRSLEEMRQVLAMMKADVGGFTRIKQVRFYSPGDKAL